MTQNPNKYTFVSFSGQHDGVARGACIVKVREEDAIEECKRLGIYPEGECLHITTFRLDTIEHEELELNTFYNRDQMLALQYPKLAMSDDELDQIGVSHQTRKPE